MLFRSIASLACTVLLAASGVAQSGKAAPSPAETATVSLQGKSITVKYGAPSMRGRKIVGALVPYGKVWRTGANDATSFTTNTALKIGDASIPAGTYTLFTLPGEQQWVLILNKQTGQWGLEYHQEQDLAHIPMKSSTLASPQEKMSITFENTKGNSTEMHIKWENTDESVKITAQ
ncbi:DUF2911 domain-containing protein [Edaphobacter flagellatus]|uniref:DUF2911 domain-containing protein n=1 Tax=Edaphobacter flagellatus TaxID=1933044 RepID=UPI0021B4A878|nr:DUF2911 domain-containing protein [Edaphobacter flagellatus]